MMKMDSRARSTGPETNFLNLYPENPMIIRRALLLCAAVLFPLLAAAEDPRYAASKSKGKLKVFILAGQSNMEGKGSVETTKRQLADPEKRDKALKRR